MDNYHGKRNTDCMKPKSELMARLRKERAAKGLVELRLWLTPEQKERVLKYVEKLKRDA